MNPAGELEGLLAMSEGQVPQPRPDLGKGEILQSPSKVGEGHSRRCHTMVTMVTLLAVGVLATVLTRRLTAKAIPGAEATENVDNAFASIIQEYAMVAGVTQTYTCEQALEEHLYCGSRKATYRCDHGSLMAKPSKPNAKEIHIRPALLDPALTRLMAKGSQNATENHKKMFNEGHCQSAVASTKRCATAASEAVQEALGDSTCKHIQDEGCYWKIVGITAQKVQAVIKELDFDLKDNRLDILANHFCLMSIEKIQGRCCEINMFGGTLKELIVKHLKGIPAMIAEGGESAVKGMCAKHK